MSSASGAAPVIASERIVVALLAASPDTFQWAGSLIPFPTGPPAFGVARELKVAHSLFAPVAERHRTLPAAIRQASFLFISGWMSWRTREARSGHHQR